MSTAHLSFQVVFCTLGELPCRRGSSEDPCKNRGSSFQGLTKSPLPGMFHTDFRNDFLEEGQLCWLLNNEWVFPRKVRRKKDIAGREHVPTPTKENHRYKKF